MLREIVRELFRQLAELDADRVYRRSDLVAAALALAVEKRVPDPSPSGMTSAVDSELGQKQPRWGYWVDRVGSGLYRFQREGSVLASGAPPLSRQVLDKLLPPEVRRQRQRPDAAPPVIDTRAPTGLVDEFRQEAPRAARSFLASDFGGMDARTLVATDLLKLDEKELQALFALQGIAL